MPCFKGLSVSIHTPEGPLPEHSVQKQARQSRIASYIPVPEAKIDPTTGHPVQSAFAISITLLTPGSVVPYSRSKPTPEDPYPRQKIVGGLPGSSLRGVYDPVIGPYVPLTPSPNETVAAYIHFDGRPKEEVATLLRKGVETWVNSRWVSVPMSEGGGLAEREFLFREVGLERWLNGLDLKGESKDVAARVERRRQRLEKRQRKRMAPKDSDDDDEDPMTRHARPLERNGVLRYGDDKRPPVEKTSGDEGMFSSESSSDDEMPVAEAAGQIKVSLFRVLASGEIKKGEYSPQFDAHDDDEGMQQDNRESNNCDADVDHTTTFAQPKSLDPRSISTQTVTGIDPPDKPFATFTFFYRGQKQLQRMGILQIPEALEQKPTTAKRKSRQIDFSTLAPLKTNRTVGFAGYRDPTAGLTPTGTSKTKAPDEMDSDADGEDGKKSNGRDDDGDAIVDESKVNLSAEEVAKRAELAEGVKKMQLKRQHSFDSHTPQSSNRKHPSLDMSQHSPPTFPSRSSGLFGSPTSTNLFGSPPLLPSTSTNPFGSPPPASFTSNNPFASSPPDTTISTSLPNTVSPSTQHATPLIATTTTPRLPETTLDADLAGSPFKKHRASIASTDAMTSPAFASNFGRDLQGVGARSVGSGAGVKSGLWANANGSRAVKPEMKSGLWGNGNGFGSASVAPDGAVGGANVSASASASADGAGLMIEPKIDEDASSLAAGQAGDVVGSGAGEGMEKTIASMVEIKVAQEETMEDEEL